MPTLPVLAYEVSWRSHKFSWLPTTTTSETGNALIDVSKQNKITQTKTPNPKNPTKTESKDKKTQRNQNPNRHKQKHPSEHKVLQLFLHHCSQL